MLLIHGWSGNHLCWNRQVNSGLAKDFRLVAVDLRGHGMSDHPLNSAAYVDRRLWAADVAAVIEQCELDRPTLVGWSYGGFVICDYIREHGQDRIAAVNFVGAAVTLNADFDHIGPAFLSNAPGGADLDLPTRIAALRRFWHAMTAKQLEPEDLETGLSGSVAVPPQVLGALISRQIDSDDVLSQLSIPVLVSPRPRRPDHHAVHGRPHSSHVPGRASVLVRRRWTRTIRRGPETLQRRARRAGSSGRRPAKSVRGGAGSASWPALRIEGIQFSCSDGAGNLDDGPVRTYAWEFSLV